ncbi:MAG: hypothetical protein ACLS3V_00220 [Streptococcus sp.]
MRLSDLYRNLDFGVDLYLMVKTVKGVTFVTPKERTVKQVQWFGQGEKVVA